MKANPTSSLLGSDMPPRPPPFDDDEDDDPDAPPPLGEPPPPIPVPPNEPPPMHLRAARGHRRRARWGARAVRDGVPAPQRARFGAATRQIGKR